MSKLKIEYLGVDDIKPYPNNARVHTEKDIQAIVESIKEFGFDDPIGIWGDDNVIVEGHGRLQAAKELHIQKVPVIRLDHLTDEQRKAYTLAHNKTAELSDWDFDLLNVELESIEDINMEEFGFEFVDEFIEHEKNAETTQDRVERILNLDKGLYPGEGDFDIPILEPVYELPEIKEWIGFNYVLSDAEPEGKAVHFFIDDYQFERLWNNPEKYVEKLRQYACVATPDFSPFADMPLVCQLYNHYRKHWVGAFLQANGVTVIPTVRASRDERSFAWYLDGEPHEGIVLISSMWTADDDSKEYFMREYDTMYDTLNPCKVFVYGNKVEGLRGNIEHIDTFTRKRWDKEDG